MMHAALDRRNSKGAIGDSTPVHIEGEMEHTLRKTEKHHPELIFNTSDSDASGQDDI